MEVVGIGWLIGICEPVGGVTGVQYARRSADGIHCRPGQ